MPAAIEPDCEPGESGKKQAHSVEADRRLALTGVVEVLAENGSGERQEGNAHEEEHVEHQEDMVSADEKLEEPVVIGPVDADHQEAQGVGAVGRPEIPERVGETLSALQMRNADLNNEQGDGDGEDAIAESFDALRAGIVFVSVFCAHGYSFVACSHRPWYGSRAQGVKRLSADPGGGKGYSGKATQDVQYLLEGSQNNAAGARAPRPSEAVG